MEKYGLIKKSKIWLDPKEMHRVLDNDGKLIDPNHKVTLSDKELLSAYKTMVLSRQQDTYMLQLQRQGRMLTFAPNFGEEALQVGAALPLRKNDWFVPAFRSNATMLHCGVTVKHQMLYWNGNERGSHFSSNTKVLPINIPIATQYSHAAGIGYALKQTKQKAVVLTFIGDGGTSEGEFYEAINLAGVRKWPVVFAINNNQYAISTPTRLETQSATLAAKAVAAGIPALRVDGNDLLASFEVFNQALAYARDGNGPILVEGFTWRQGQHTTSDDPRAYRTKEEETEKEKSEPMHRIQNYLFSRKIITPEENKVLWDKQLAEVKVAYQNSVSEINVKLHEVFDYTYVNMPPEIARQKKEAEKFFSEKDVE